MGESFWNIPDLGEITPPLAILREQANALARQTRGLLVGVVTSRPVSRRDLPTEIAMINHNINAKMDLAVDLDIEVPALNNYRYGLLTYWQPVQLYPGYIYDNLTDDVRLVTSEDEFITHLKDVLHSVEVRRIIASLVAQASA